MRPHLNEQIYFQSKLGVNLAGFQKPESKARLALGMEGVIGRYITSADIQQSTAIKNRLQVHKIIF